MNLRSTVLGFPLRQSRGQILIVRVRALPRSLQLLLDDLSLGINVPEGFDGGGSAAATIDASLGRMGLAAVGLVVDGGGSGSGSSCSSCGSTLLVWRGWRTGERSLMVVLSVVLIALELFLGNAIAVLVVDHLLSNAWVSFYVTDEDGGAKLHSRCC